MDCGINVERIIIGNVARNLVSIKWCLISTGMLETKNGESGAFGTSTGGRYSTGRSSAFKAKRDVKAWEIMSAVFAMVVPSRNNPSSYFKILTISVVFEINMERYWAKFD